MSAKTIRVEVTTEDIEAGIPDADYCPVALALDRAMNLPWKWHVTAAYEDGHCRAYLAPVGGVPTTSLVLPLRVARFVGRFDLGKPVKPFAFRVPA